MRLALLLLLLLLVAPAQAVTYFSCGGGGNWSAPGSWALTDGGICLTVVVPGNGDKAIIRPNETVTVDVNTTVGQSAAMTGTVTSGNTAIAVGNGALGTPSAKLVIASSVTLHVRGNLTVLNSVSGLRTTNYWPVTISQDATLEFDTSAAVDPTQHYAFTPDPAQISLCPDTVFRGTGTSGHPATITSNASGGNGYSDLGSIAAIGYYHSLTYTDIRNFGTSSSSFPALLFKNFASVNLGSEVGTLDHVRFYTSGLTIITSGRADNSLLITRTQCTSPLAGYCYYNDSAPPTAPATKTFTYNSNNGTGDMFGDGVVGGTFAVTNWTLDENLFFKFLNMSNDAAGSNWLSFNKNVFLNATTSAPSGTGTSLHGNVSGCYFAQYIDENNFHGWIFNTGVGGNDGKSITGCIFDSFAYSDPVSYNDSPNAFVAGITAGKTWSLTNTISLPGADSPHYDIGNMLTMSNCSGGSISMTNNTSYTAYVNSAVSGTEGNATAGCLGILKGNIVYSYVAGAAAGWLWRTDTGAAVCTTDILTPSGTAYNAAYNVKTTEARACSTNIGNSYSGDFTSTPPGTGSNVTSNPTFVDDNRGLVQSAQGFFSEANCSAWVTTTVYTYTFPGALCVSTTDAAYFRGKTINWVLTATNTADATNKPGARDGTWRTYWEPQGLYDYRTALFAGTTYTVPGCTACSVSAAFLQWIRNGMRPTNGAYRNGSAPSGYIGAMDPLIPNVVRQHTTISR